MRLLDQDATRRLPWPDGAFDLVLAVGVVEHLPVRWRRAQVDEYYRVLAPGGHIAILDTPNRWFPLETHSVGPAAGAVAAAAAGLALRAARAGRGATAGSASRASSPTAPAGATPRSPTACRRPGPRGVVDLTEAAGYGLRFFRATARSRTRRALLPLFGLAAAALGAAGRPPSLALPYLNLLFRSPRRPSGDMRIEIRAQPRLATCCCRTGEDGAPLAGIATTAGRHQPRLQRAHLLERGRHRVRPHPPLRRGRAARLSCSGARGLAVGGGAATAARSSWAPGSGYSTTLIAAHADLVLAVEPVPDMQARAPRAPRAGLDHVRVVGATAFDLPAHVGEASVDSAFILQSLHHFHRRDEVFRALGRVVRPGGRLFVVEPHHNLRRVAPLF